MLASPPQAKIVDNLGLDNKGLDSSVGRALVRQTRGLGFKPRFSQIFFSHPNFTILLVYWLSTLDFCQIDNGPRKFYPKKSSGNTAIVTACYCVPFQKRQTCIAFMRGWCLSLSCSLVPIESVTCIHVVETSNFRN